MNVHERAAGAVVVQRAGSGEWQCVLVLQHNGDWGLPKGHVEAGETDAQTAVREVREETGLSITLIADFGESVRYTLPSGHEKEVVYFLAQPSGGTLAPQPEEIQDTRWFEIGHALDRVSYAAVRSVLAAAYRYLSSGRL